MTDFTIPEEAVGAAFIAARAASASESDLDDVSIGAMTAAIAAALPVMFQPTYQLWLRSSGVWEDLDESVYLTLSEDNEEGAMKFRVSYVPKESK